ncbi:MAG: nickel pincer cofactor biosynthesis protein LarC [Methanoregula sp.]|nr:nickel pincer cofactor biosynthesis protein LarC [Methanoregula sp.]
MRILIFDPFHGAAGDMITGALLSLGADEKTVAAAMGAVVADPGIEIVTRAGVRAVKVHTKATPAHRTLTDVERRLDEAAPAVPQDALAMARRVFARMNAAEESVHGAHVHFHEVGADDAIADVIGACTALAALKADGVAVLPVAVGSGTVTSAHGTMPVPAPATAEILKNSGLAVTAGTGDGELCTPTGAALLAEFSTIALKDIGAYTILATGYGAGTKDPKDAPNVLRVMLVETTTTKEDTVDILETNVDDVSGEVIGEALARFMAAGARDASAAPILMKKGRPGYLVTVIALPADSPALARLMAEELGTLGIRCLPAIHRFVADRTAGTMEVTIGGHTRSIPVKYGFMDGHCYTAKPEFDAANAWAKELGLPVREVLRAITDALGKKTGTERP